MKRRLFTILLFLCLVITLFPLDTQATTTGKCGENVKFVHTSHNGRLTIYGTGNMWEFDDYGYYTVPWRGLDIKTVIIEYGVTNIGRNAFKKCTTIESVSIPNTVTKIGDNAFYGCSSLESITIPKSVTTLGTHLFSDCISLETVIFRPEIVELGERTFWACKSLKTVTFDGTLQGKLGEAVFAYCDSLTSFRIPGTVTTIGYRAFDGCSSLSDVVIEEGVTSIRKDAFDGTAIESITIPSSVAYIESDALSVESIKNITIHTETLNQLTKGIASSGWLDYVHVIGDAPESTVHFFGGTTSDNFVIYYDEGTSGWVEPFWNGYVIEVWGKPWSEKSGNYGENITWTLSTDGVLTLSGTGDIPRADNVDTPPWFNMRNRINKVVITDGITGIGDYTFKESYNLTSVEIAGSVKTIGKCAFLNCAALTDVTLNEGLLEIGMYAFSNCKSLTDIVLPDSVTTLESRAFYECIALKNVKLSANLTYLGSWTFENCQSLLEIEIPACVSSLDDMAFDYCNNLIAIWVDENNAHYSSDHVGALYNKDKTELIFVPNGMPGSFVVPETVTTLGMYAFQNCAKLTEITLSDNITKTWFNTFRACTQLVTINLGNGITAIESFAFESCGNLTTVNWGTSVTMIGYGAFRYCSALTELEIPESVTYIQGAAFNYCPALHTLYFRGDAPYFEYDALANLTTTAYYPANNPTWTEEVMQQYNGTITWLPYIPECSDHEYVAVVTEPTCEEHGYTTYTCSVCGHSYVDDYTDPLEHDYEDGYCKRCGEEEKQALWGDVNGDGKVNHNDARLVLQYYVGIAAADSLDLNVADVNGDGKINHNDARQILQFYVGIISAFPVETQE